MKKTIYSLPALKEVLLASNQRYLKFISDVETPEVGAQKLHEETTVGIMRKTALTPQSLLAELHRLEQMA